MMLRRDTPVRIARPADDLGRVARFYVEGLGFELLGSFEDHDGFDGVMVGLPGASFHLEFTHRRAATTGPAPAPAASAAAVSEDTILVFYIPDREAWQAAVDRMRRAGFPSVRSSNPYWERHGITFEDPEGSRVVLENAGWPT